MSSLEHQRYALMNRTTRSEKTKSHIGVTQGLTVQQVLVANLNVHVLVQLAKLLDWNVHVLIVPLGVLSTVDAGVGAPLLALTDTDPHEGILLVHHASAVDFKMSTLEDKSEPSSPWNNEAGWLLHNSNLGLNYSNVGRRLDNRDPARSSHALELGAHYDPSAVTESDLLLLGAEACEDIEGHAGLRDDLEGVALVLDHDVHFVLEQVGWDGHELQHPLGFLTAVVAGLGGEIHCTDLDVADRRHFVKRPTNFVVELCVQDVKLEEAHKVFVKIRYTI